MNYESTNIFLNKLIVTSKQIIATEVSDISDERDEIIRTLVISAVLFVIGIPWKKQSDFSDSQLRSILKMIAALRSLYYRLTFPTEENVNNQINYLFKLSKDSEIQSASMINWLDHFQNQLNSSTQHNVIHDEALSLSLDEESEKQIKTLFTQTNVPQCPAEFIEEIKKDPKSLYKARLLGLF